MAGINSDNELLRDNYLVTSVEFVQHTSPLESSSSHLPNSTKNHSMWWLNTRRRCHKHSSNKRSYIRRKR